MELGIEKRNEILITALFIENKTSKYLADLLGIKNYNQSKTLGNKSSCLTFNQKVDLLIDMNALSTSDRNKFRTFMEIRNQFMHNINAKTYVDCISFIDGKDKYLLQTYPQSPELTKEEQLRNASLSLAEDVRNLTFNVTNKIVENLSPKIENAIFKNGQEAFVETIEEIKTSLDDFFEKEIEKSKTFNSRRLKGFGSALSKTIYKIWFKKFKEISKRDK